MGKVVKKFEGSASIDPSLLKAQLIFFFYFFKCCFLDCFGTEQKFWQTDWLWQQFLGAGLNRTSSHLFLVVNPILLSACPKPKLSQTPKQIYVNRILRSTFVRCKCLKEVYSISLSLLTKCIACKISASFYLSQTVDVRVRACECFCRNENLIKFFVLNMISHSKSVKDAFFDLPQKLCMFHSQISNRGRCSITCITYLWFHSSKLKILWHPMSTSLHHYILCSCQSTLQWVVGIMINFFRAYKNALTYSWLATLWIVLSKFLCQKQCYLTYSTLYSVTIIWHV